MRDDTDRLLATYKVPLLADADILFDHYSLSVVIAPVVTNRLRQRFSSNN